MSQAEVAPAEGERRALFGYVPRYRVCARLVYEAVLQGTFDWLQLQSAEAGQVDDFIIATPGRLDAYQVKHGETATTYTLASLLRSDRSHGDASTDSLVKQLCSAWQRLTSIHSDRHVHVHLVLRGIPTKIGSIKDLPQTDRQKNFQTFLNEYWLADPPEWPNANWSSVAEAIRKVCDLDRDGFGEFRLHSHFDFMPDVVRSGRSENSVEQAEDNDVEKLKDYLLDRASGDTKPKPITRDELLRDLGWIERFTPLYRQEFKIGHDTSQLFQQSQHLRMR